MTPTIYACADADGVFCITCESTDYCSPRIVKNYWPTHLRTRDVLAYFGQADVSGLTVRPTMPGEFFVGVIRPSSTCWQTGRHIGLTAGSHTQSIKTETRDAAPPKTRCPYLWDSGGWVVRKAKKNERVSPL